MSPRVTTQSFSAVVRITDDTAKDFTAGLKLPRHVGVEEASARLAGMVIDVVGLNLTSLRGKDGINPAVVSLNDQPCNLPVTNRDQLARSIATTLDELEKDC